MSTFLKDYDIAREKESNLLLQLQRLIGKGRIAYPENDIIVVFHAELLLKRSSYVYFREDTETLLAHSFLDGNNRFREWHG